MTDILNFINGKFVPSQSEQWLENINPATEEVIGRITNSNELDVIDAINAASLAQISWAQMPQSKRANILKKMANIIDSRLDELAQIESKDNGKPVSVARTVDIPRAATNLRFFAEAINQSSSESYSNGNCLNTVKRTPVGVVSCISPWNLPLYLFTWKIAPALVTGNCVIAKPSEVTPMTASLLGEIANEAGLPAGVLNIIQGEGPRVGHTMCTHKKIKAVSFTGSTATGRVISELAATHFKKSSLEMGGKNPTIIFDDCDLERAIKTASLAAFSNQGQICLCGSRILIQESIYEQVKEKLIEKANALKIGDPSDPQTQQGSLVSRTHFEKVLGCIEKAKAEGGEILCGGERFGEKGLFIKPTLIEGIGPKGITNQEEIFGPVATLQSFKTEKEAIDLANDTRYGLSASIWTNDLNRANRLGDQIDAGIIWINTWMNRDLRTPFGGMKESGMGREGGQYALNFFTEPKNICIQY